MYETNGQLNSWWQRHIGSTVLLAEIQEMDAMLPGLPGKHALLLGCTEQLRLLASTFISYQCILNNSVTSFSTSKGVRASWEKTLPFADNSLDLVLVPHALEILSDASFLVKEINRVLAPGGHVFVFGFNRSMLWHLWYFFYPKHCHIPWGKQLRGRRYLRRQLRTLDCAVIKRKTIVYAIPPDKNRKIMGLNACLSALKKIMPCVGGVYMVHLQKKTFGATPIGLSWWSRCSQKMQFSEALVNPTPSMKQK